MYLCSMNKIKIFNDPIHGIIRFKHELLYDIIDHPIFQRLRRIKQMGLSSLVYPGANHTRFEHALGALHLMTRALDVLVDKGVKISEEEYLGCCIAILCHDLGHGPYSHALEYELLPISHEEITLIFMKELAGEFGSPVEVAITIFTNKHNRKFLNQLVSSQLDMDRLDYLTRDSFFSGVVEGKVGYDRIIMMLNVVNDELVVEEKGISSVEKFLLSRKMMYSQVYLHRASLSAELMMKMFMKRWVKLIHEHKEKVLGGEVLIQLIKEAKSENANIYNIVKQLFVRLDDADVLQTLKKNENSCDQALKILSKCMLNRKLFRVTLCKSVEELKSTKREIENKAIQSGVSSEIISCLTETVDWNVSTYNRNTTPIHLLMKNGEILEFSKVSNFLPQRDFENLKYVIAPKMEYLL